MKTVEVAILCDSVGHQSIVRVFTSYQKAREGIPEIRKEYQSYYGGDETGRWVGRRLFWFQGATITITRHVVIGAVR